MQAGGKGLSCRGAGAHSIVMLCVQVLENKPTAAEMDCWMEEGAMRRSDNSIGHVDVYQGCFAAYGPDWGCRLPTLDSSLPYIHLQGQSKQVSASRRLALWQCPSLSKRQHRDLRGHHEALRMSCQVAGCKQGTASWPFSSQKQPVSTIHSAAKGKGSQGGQARGIRTQGLFSAASGC